MTPAAKKRRRAEAAPVPEFPIVVETFHVPDAYTRGRVEQSEPSCFNGDVRVRRYRITFDLIDEPNEVLSARLQALWDASDNHHQWHPLRAAAEKIDYELQGSPGSNRQKPAP